MLLLLVIAVLYCCVTGYQIPGLFLTGVGRRQRQDCITITHRQLALRSSTSLSVKSWNEPGIFEGEDEEESVTFRTIVKNYLLNKYRNCRESDVGEGIDCRFMCNLTQVSEIVRSVLPPVTQAALQQEVRLTMDKFEGKDVVDSEDFLEAVMSNNYWREAGGLVVKELLFLDCIYAYYHLDGQRWLGDE